MKQFRPVLWTVGALAIVAIALIALLAPHLHSQPAFVTAISSPIYKPQLQRDDLATAIGRQRISSAVMDTGLLPVQYQGHTYQAKLTLDRELQRRIENIYERYAPAYAAFIAMDPDTGKILAMVDHSEDGAVENLILHASYPAASVFKVITSAAALEEHKIQPQSIMSYNGATTTLYKHNLRDDINRWTRFTSVEEALAKSINTVFAKIAIHRLGQQTLQKYADRFGFNQQIKFDMPVDISTVHVPDDMYGLAEAGSGYTKRQTLSPLQGALIASAIINHGHMPNPYFVQEVLDTKGDRVYQAMQFTTRSPVEPETARLLSQMMEQTIKTGTAHKIYRDYDHNPILSKLFIGAKTGSLSGENPEGKYDWFVGFAQATDDPTHKIAFAAMTVNRKFWRIKSSYVAREAILEYFGRKTSL